MPNLYVTIYKNMARDSLNALTQVPETPPVAEWSLEIGVESNESKEFPNEARFISVRAESACWLAFGQEPKAESGFHPIDAGEVAWYGVVPGHRISVIL